MFHRIVNLVPYNSKRILNTIKKYIDVYAPESYVGKLPDSIHDLVFNELGIKMVQPVQIFVAAFNYNSERIHIHSDDWSGNIKRAINIPLENCNDVYMNWYKVIDSTKIYTEGHDGRYHPVRKVPLECSEIIETISCSKPFIADISQWHSGEMRAPGIGIMLSVRFWPFSGIPFT